MESKRQSTSPGSFRVSMPAYSGIMAIIRLNLVQIWVSQLYSRTHRRALVAALHRAGYRTNRGSSWRLTLRIDGIRV
jgi:hypothetical protein